MKLKMKEDALMAQKAKEAVDNALRRLLGAKEEKEPTRGASPELRVKRLHSIKNRVKNMLATTKSAERRERLLKTLGRLEELEPKLKAQILHTHCQTECVMLQEQKYKPSRRLTYQEERVDFEGLNDSFNEIQGSLEDELARITQEELERALANAKNKLDAGDIAGLAAIAFLFRQKVLAAISRTVKTSYDVGRDGAAAEIDPANGTRPTTPLQDKQLMNVDAADITEGYATNLENTLSSAIKSGLAASAATAAIIAAARQSVVDEASKEITNISGTIVGQYINMGRNNVIFSNIEKIVAMQRSEVLDGRTCALCISLDERVVSPTDPMAYMQIVHTHCVAPDTVVESPDLLRAFRIPYKGDLIRFTFKSGKTLSVTPKHVLLTDVGFLMAEHINESHKLIKPILSEGESFGIKPDIDGMPSTAADLFVALSEISGMTSRKMPVSSKDFHGDGVFAQGDIDIVDVDSSLKNDGVSTLPQHVRQYMLDGTCKTSDALPSECSLSEFLTRTTLTTDSIMRGSDISSVLLLAPSFNHEDVSLRISSAYDLRLKEAVLHNVPTHSKEFRDLTLRLAGSVATDDIVRIETVFHDGYVYDLGSKSTLYLANGYVSSNCRGTWVPILAIDEDQPEVTGIPKSISDVFDKIDGRPVVNGFKQLKKPINEISKPAQEEIKRRLEAKKT